MRIQAPTAAPLLAPSILDRRDEVHLRVQTAARILAVQPDELEVLLLLDAVTALEEAIGKQDMPVV